MRAALATLLLVACSTSPHPPPARPGPEPPPTAAPAVDPVPVYLHWTDAANAGDWKALAALYAADATVTPASSGSTLRGRDQLVTLFESLAAGFPDQRSRPLLLIAAGNRLYAVAWNTGTNTVSLGAMPATNRATGMLVLGVIEVDPSSGLIAHHVLYADNLNFMGQLGLWDGSSRPAGDSPDPGAAVEVVRTGSAAAEADDAATVRTAAALLGAHDAAGLTRLYAADAELDDQSDAGPERGAAAIEHGYADLFAAFPDLAISDLDVVGAGDLAVATYRLTGTHGGPWPRLGAPAGTMRQIDLEVAAVFRFRDGKIVRHQVFSDGLAAAMQLGLYQLPGDQPPEGFEVKPAPR